jgi:hypothetical protein
MKKVFEFIKKNKVILGVLAIVGLYIYISKRKKEENKRKGMADKRKKLFKVDMSGYNDCYNQCKTMRIVYTNDDFPLGIGSKGERVEELQQAIKDMGVDIAVDGYFGCQTSCLTKALFGKDTFNESDFNEFVA